MVFPIYVSLEKLDQRLLEASADLGATPWRTFLQVTLPLSLPGVATGSMLVFILLMGEFLIPALLGGGKVFFIGNALVDLFLQSRNWPFGAAVSMALVVIMLVTVTVYMRFVLGRGDRAARSRWSEPMRVYVTAVYVFLYAPIALIVLFSFNAGRYATDLQGFSTVWYGKALANPFVIEALRTSLIVGLTSAVLATIIGTMAALGAAARARAAARRRSTGCIYVAIMIPGIVIGIATLIAFVTLFDVVNPAAGGTLAGGARRRTATAARAGLDDRRPYAVHHGAGRS